MTSVGVMLLGDVVLGAGWILAAVPPLATLAQVGAVCEGGGVARRDQLLGLSLPTQPSYDPGGGGGRTGRGGQPANIR